ncbi:MAG: flagellar hook-basal body complex protein FliE [Porticoccaceae bacterium]
MNSTDISQVLAQIRVMSGQAHAGVKLSEGPAGNEPAMFSDVLKTSLEAVNTAQARAGELSEKFQAGDPSIDLAHVMVAVEKASVSFEAMTQVRNKLVEAYQEIMRMQV